MHGQGRLVSIDGSTYHGEFRQGTKHGQGMALYANRDSFCGEWVGGQQAEGVYVFGDSVVYANYTGE